MIDAVDVNDRLLVADEDLLSLGVDEPVAVRLMDVLPDSDTLGVKVTEGVAEYVELALDVADSLTELVGDQERDDVPV